MAKQILYGEGFRQAILPRRQHAGGRGEGDARAQGPERCNREEVRFADHHQGRRDGGQGDRG